MDQPNANYLSSWMANSASNRFNHSRTEWFEHNYASLLPANPSARILEIGPGYCEFLTYLKSINKYTDVHAIDIAQDVVDHCNEIYPGCVELVNSLEDYFSERTNSLDLVVMFHVLEHLPKNKVISVLSHIRESLQGVGKLIIEVPNMANPAIASYKRYADFTHEIGFTVESLNQVLLLSGFKEIRVVGGDIPKGSAGRFIQHYTQVVWSLYLKLLMYPYIPRFKSSLSPAIIAIAN